MTDKYIGVQVIEIAGTPIVELTERGQILTADVEAAAKLCVEELARQPKPTFVLVNLADVTAFENLFQMVIKAQPLVKAPNFRGGVAVLPGSFSAASSYINIAAQVLGRNIITVKTYPEAVDYLKQRLQGHSDASK